MEEYYLPLTKRIKRIAEYDVGMTKKAEKEMSFGNYLLFSLIISLALPIKFLICTLHHIFYVLPRVFMGSIIIFDIKVPKKENTGFDTLKSLNLWKPSKESLDFSFNNLSAPEDMNFRDIKTNINPARIMGESTLPTADILGKQRKNIGEASIILRKALYSNNFTLDGTIIDTKFYKLSDTELLEAAQEGSLNKPFMVQYISFGDEINKSLKLMLGDKIKLSNRKKNCSSCIIIENGDTSILSNEINEIFSIENSKICLTQNE